MTPNLGLVCQTTTGAVRFRTITRTRLRSLEPQSQVAALRELYSDNLRRLSAAIDFCVKRKIRMYRLTSDLFPQSEDGVGAEVLAESAGALAVTGQRATTSGIRLLMHPDQFVVLSSEKPHVVENSIGILRRHGRLLDLLQQPRSPWAALEIHGGKSGRGRELVEVIRNNLPDEVRSRLVLENDEYAYSAATIHDICQRAGVPMVFDAHHHVVHEKLETYDDPSVAAMVTAARSTWPHAGWQVVHISNGRDSFGDAHHADFVDVMPLAYRDVPWIEVEAKQKERAIARLRRRWKYDAHHEANRDGSARSPRRMHDVITTTFGG